MFTVFTVTCVFMDGSISAYLNVCNVTHFAVISQTTPFLLRTVEYQRNAKNICRSANVVEGRLLAEMVIFYFLLYIT